jgi:hypothetical protein
MGIFTRGKGGIDNIKSYYEQLKTDNWQGNQRGDTPNFGASGKKRHATQAYKLAGLYMLRTFRTTEPRVYTAAMYTFAPAGNTKIGKLAKGANAALRTAQSYGAPSGFTRTYADIPITKNIKDSYKRITSIVGGAGALSNDIRKRYGLQYTAFGGLQGFPGFDPEHGMYNEYDVDQFNDLIPVVLVDGEKSYQLRGTIAGLSDAISPSWNETTYIGRPDAMVSYGGFKREISFDLTLAATRPSHLRLMYKRINQIANFVLPQRDAGYPGTRYNGRMLDLTVGNYIKDELCIMTGFTITPSEDASWEIMDPGGTGSDNSDYPSKTLNQGLAQGVINKFNSKKSKLTDGKKSGTQKRFIVPKVLTINMAFMVLHNKLVGADEHGDTYNAIFDHEGWTDDMTPTPTGEL